MIITLGEALKSSPYSVKRSVKLPMSKYDYKSGEVAYLHDLASMKGDRAPLKSVPMNRVRATQDRVSTSKRRGEPVFKDMRVHPVMMHTKRDNLYHVLDGHHRSEDALKKGKKQIKAHVFSNPKNEVDWEPEDMKDY